MITQKIPDRRRYKTKRFWLTRWFTGGNHRTGELAHHAIDRIADENARSFAERAKADADRHLAEADTEVLPRIDQHRDQQDEDWDRTPSGIEGWTLADVERVFGPLPALADRKSRRHR